MQSHSELPHTLLSAIHPFTSPDLLSAQSLHPFSSTAENAIADLRDLLQSTDTIAHTTNVFLNAPAINSKTVSLLRQHTAAQHGLHLTSQYVRQTLAASRTRAAYGEDVPFDRTQIADWCVAHIGQWGAAVGMEAFPEAETAGRRTLVLGGKVLVLDVEFALHPRADVVGVRTSYAVPNGVAGGNAAGSASLDGFLVDALKAWVTAVQRSDREDAVGEVEINGGSGVTTARFGKEVSESLRYLMRLDRFASREGDSGIRWFNDIDTLGGTLERLAQAEARAVASSLSLSETPLDIFLLRAHALPLPYLTSPSLTFLVHLSPRTYLSLQHASSPLRASAPPPSPSLPTINVPYAYLRSILASHTPPPGTALVTLSLRPLKTHVRPPPASDLPILSSRPKFALLPNAAAFDHMLPVAMNMDVDSAAGAGASGVVGPDEGQCAWVLDFTLGGRMPGIVMSQARMREIEAVVNPFSTIRNLQGGGGMLSFTNGSWVDMLLNPANPISPERYTAVYTSPTGMHPPLHLSLAAPDEPGFILEHVQVYNMKEVWSVLEIVREQCWLNEALTGCQWSTEGLLTVPEEEDARDDQVTDSDLQAILDGTFTPLKIPVTVYLPSTPPPSSDDDLFGPPLGADASALGPGPGGGSGAAPPRIVMTLPERPPMSGIVEVSVAHDAARARGVAVDVRGAMGAEIDVEGMEEAVRRGGVFGLPGRVWAAQVGG